MELQHENIIQSQDKKPSTSNSVIYYTSKDFHCSFCTKGFTDKRNLVRHVRVVHHDIRPFSCEGCKKAFGSKQELIRHSENGCKFRHIPNQKQITKPSTQPLLQNFQNTSAVQHQHENIIQSQDKIPSTSKEFCCNYCTRMFKERRNLTRHVSVVHHNVKPFFCEDCKKAFGSKQELVRHSEKSCRFRNILKHIKKPGQENLTGLFTCKRCLGSFDTYRGLVTHKNHCSILCSKCNVFFCSEDSLELHFNSCEGPKIEMLKEKLQITIVDKFSCSKRDMDFDLRETLEEDSGNCEIAMLQPGEEHLDHTYSKGVFTATSVKQGNVLKGIDKITIKR